MTLIIAGYSRGEFSRPSVYFAADSHITQSNMILVKGFKKVIEIPVRIKNINFAGDWFNNYYGYRYETTCAIAFAGSSLVSQHIINSIKNHLGELYPTYHNGEYQLALSCEEYKHLQNGYYSDDMFLPSHLDGLATSEFLANVVEHSIEAVLDNARKYPTMSRNFSAYAAEFIFATQCPVTHEYQIFQYEIVQDDALKAKVKQTKIEQNDIAIIGAKQYKTEALNVLNNKNNTDLDSELMFDFLNEVIDNETSIGNFGIGKPTGLYKLDGRILERTKFRRDNHS